MRRRRQSSSGFGGRLRAQQRGTEAMVTTEEPLRASVRIDRSKLGSIDFG